MLQNFILNLAISTNNMHNFPCSNKRTCPMIHMKNGKLCRRRSDVREASENVSNVSRQFLIWFIELRPHILRSGGLRLLFQDSRLLLYFLFLFQEGKVYENAGKQTNRYVSNQSSEESERAVQEKREKKPISLLV